MDVYKVYLKESIQKDFRLIPNNDIKKILRRIESLSYDPRPPGCEKLTDREQYRVRQGRYRIVYSVQDNESTVYIVKIAHRKDIYR
jgi:mRNA interferase RelE/StbE